MCGLPNQHYSGYFKWITVWGHPKQLRIYFCFIISHFVSDNDSVHKCAFVYRIVRVHNALSRLAWVPLGFTWSPQTVCTMCAFLYSGDVGIYITCTRCVRFARYSYENVNVKLKTFAFV